MKKMDGLTKKTLVIMMMIVSVLFIWCSKANAGNTEVIYDEDLMTEEQKSEHATKGINDIITAGNKFIKIGKDAENENTSINAFVDNLMGIGQILVIIGGSTLLIVAAIMGVKWITATPDKQAKLKTQLIGLVIAAVVIFGAVGIWNFVINIMNDVETKVNEGISQSTDVKYLNI